MKKKWLLVNPPTGKYIRDTRCQASVEDVFAVSERPPVDLAYISGAISSNGDICMIKDYAAEKLDMKDLKRDIQELKINYVIINTTIFTYEEDLEICDMIKEINSKIITIAKGAIFFSESDKLMMRYPSLDIAVSYEEEKAFDELSSEMDLSLINNITYRSNGKIIRNPQRLEDVFNLKKPRIDLIKHSLYRRPDTNKMQAVIVVGRGCPGKCIYCLAPIVGGHKARYRKVDDVIDEINEYYQRYNIDNFYFSADTLTWNAEWVKELCEAINKLNYKISWLGTTRIDRITDELMSIMKKSGCWGLSIGIESGNEVILKYIKKGLKKQQIIDAVKICKKYKFVCLFHFIIGFPWDSKETIIETIKFAKKLRGNIVEFYIATPLLGTELYNIAINDTALTLKKENERLNYVTATINTHTLSGKELYQLRNKAIRSIYMDPLFYARSLIHIKSISQFLNCSKFIIRKIFSILKRLRIHLG